jgi:hypothetical protein
VESISCSTRSRAWMHVIGTSPDQASSRRNSLGSLNSTQKQRRRRRNGRGIAQSTRKTTLRPITSPSLNSAFYSYPVLAILRAALLYLLAPAGRRTLHHALADHICWNTVRYEMNDSRCGSSFLTDGYPAPTTPLWETQGLSAPCAVGGPATGRSTDPSIASRTAEGHQGGRNQHSVVRVPE